MIRKYNSKRAQHIIITIRIKEDQKECKNYRVYNFIKHSLSNLVNTRLKSHTESILGDYQYSFKSERSTISAT